MLCVCECYYLVLVIISRPTDSWRITLHCLTVTFTLFLYIFSFTLCPLTRSSHLITPYTLFPYFSCLSLFLMLFFQLYLLSSCSVGVQNWLFSKLANRRLRKTNPIIVKIILYICFYFGCIRMNGGELYNI